MTRPEWIRCGSGDEAVETAVELGRVLVRNSRIPLEVISFSSDAWSDFVSSVRNGGFDGVDAGDTT